MNIFIDFNKLTLRINFWSSMQEHILIFSVLFERPKFIIFVLLRKTK